MFCFWIKIGSLKYIMGVGLPQISSDWEMRRIFFRFEIHDFGIFWIGKFWEVFCRVVCMQD